MTDAGLPQTEGVWALLDAWAAERQAGRLYSLLLRYSKDENARSVLAHVRADADAAAVGLLSEVLGGEIGLQSPNVLTPSSGTSLLDQTALA